MSQIYNGLIHYQSEDIMANQTDPQFRLAELFKQEKCYTIDQLSRGRCQESCRIFL